MEKIQSFCVDHRKLCEGVYISRKDGDCVTYDLRFCRPNTGVVLDNSSIHTTEHMLATYFRNSEIGNRVVYFGPMGCQTGFYLIVREYVTSQKVVETLKSVLKMTVEYEGEVFGKSEIECGNYKNLELKNAKKICKEYLGKINKLDDVMKYEA